MSFFSRVGKVLGLVLHIVSWVTGVCIFTMGWSWVEAALNSSFWLEGTHQFAMQNVIIGGTTWLFLGLAMLPPIRRRLGVIPFLLVGGLYAIILGWWVFPHTAWWIHSWWVGYWPRPPFLGVQWVAFYPWVYLVSALILRALLLFVAWLVSGTDSSNSLAIGWAAFFAAVKSGAKKGAQLYLDTPNPTFDDLCAKGAEEIAKKVGEWFIREVVKGEHQELLAAVEERASWPYRHALAMRNGYLDVATLHQIILPRLVGKRVYVPLLALNPADLAAVTNLGPLHPSAVGRNTALTMYNGVASGLPAVYKDPVTAVVVPRLTWTPSNGK